MTKISNRYRRKLEQYKRFSKSWEHMLDYSEEAAVECLLWESNGKPLERSNNGYVIGKGWLDVQLTMWREDLKQGLLFLTELDDEDLKLLGIDPISRK